MKPAPLKASIFGWQLKCFCSLLSATNHNNIVYKITTTIIILILIFCSVLPTTTGISGRGKDQTTGNTGGNGESGLLTIVAKIGQRVHRCPILSNIPLLPMLSQVSSTSGEDGSGEDGDEKSVSTVEQTTQ